MNTISQNGSESATAELHKTLEIAERYCVSVEQYLTFMTQGFLVVPQLVSPQEIQALRDHTDDLMQGKLPEQSRTMAGRDVQKDTGLTGQGLEAPPAHLSPDEKAQFFLRIHMLHRQLELHERFMLHPRVLDVLEALIGPDVLAMQTMLFLKPPGKPGQGWHQDAYYIPTIPDTVIGAWLAIDDSDEQNGAMCFAQGSQVEPIYPPTADSKTPGQGRGDLENILFVNGVSDPDDEKNDLAKIAAKYPEVLCAAKAGDVVFFGSHVLHRSKKNWSQDRTRRSFVSHYCNARSFTQWGADGSDDGYSGLRIEQNTGMTNGSHILARGDSHLPFAKPRFDTPCTALMSDEERRSQRAFATASMADMDSGMMGTTETDPNAEHDHSDDEGTM